MTTHTMISANSSNLSMIPSKSVNLVVTSPPYPMIEMWDEMFSEQDPDIRVALTNGDGLTAFSKMHEALNAVWRECDRVLDDNGFVCINIGDATRTINGEFQLYSNHTIIINQFLSMGYSVLPDVHWRKQSNAPNKFMDTTFCFFKKTEYLVKLMRISQIIVCSPTPSHAFQLVRKVL